MVFSILPYFRMCFVVGSSLGRQVQYEVLRFCVHINGGLRHGNADGFRRISALKLDNKRTGCVCPVGIRMLCSVHGLRRKEHVIRIDLHLCSERRRIIDLIRNCDGRVLRLGAFTEGTRNND